jgi:flagellar biosynthesis protein FlhB
MAQDRDNADRTIEPTKRRLADARKRGMAARSTDLTSAVVMLVGFLLLSALGPHAMTSLVALVRGSLSSTGLGAVSPAEAVAALWSSGKGTAGLAAMFAALLGLVALVIGAAQVGFHPAVDRPFAAWDRVSPARGLGRMFSQRSMSRGFFAMAKVAVVVALAWRAVSWTGAPLVSLARLDAPQIASSTGSLVVGLGVRTAASLGALGVIELLYERWRLRRDLRMTRPEWLEEMKSSEGNPATRGRIRGLTREASARKQVGEGKRYG